jgi:hypothetical protein
MAAIEKMSGAVFCLRAVEITDWNTQLSPWRAAAVYGASDFGEGAAGTLDEILKLTTDREKKYYLGGYSLAGLFALWSACRRSVFSGVAAVSPSLWFPCFTEYLAQNRCLVPQVYLSLGVKESRVKNPVVSTVADRLRDSYDILRGQGIDCTLEWNPGNHFCDVPLRMAKGFSAVLLNEKT